MKKLIFLALLLPVTFFNGFSQTDVNAPARSNSFKTVDISGQWFLAYQSRFKDNQQMDNLFTLKRGYVTFKKDFNKTFSVRYTQDITLDKEGSDAGNVEMRLKYLYLKVNLRNFSFFHNSFLEIGMIHTPWLDFEQHINDYRVQSPMFLEASGLFNSADFGINMVTLFGGKIDESYRESVSSSYPGKYGSFSVGIFNGGGYHAIEQNNNKTIAARLSLRPFPSTLPGLQFSLHGIYGKGNSELNPDFNLKHAFVSYESQRAIITAQAFMALGNSYGSLIDITNEPIRNQGFSFFGELYIIQKRLSALGSYSFYENMDDEDDFNRKLLGGVCYHFLNDQKLLLDIEHLNSNDHNQIMYELALEIRF
jgi:hypothetical protein